MNKILVQLFLMSIVFILAPSKASYSQVVGIGTTSPDPSAALDITGTAKGLLIPRMRTNSINAIANPAKGLLAYDSLTNQLMVNTGKPAAPNWKAVSSASSGWNLGGNNGINPANQFIGTIDNQPLRFRINSIQAGELNPAKGNVLWGLRAGQNNTTGFSNVAIGTDALKLNSDRNNLVAIGDSALFNNGVNPANFLSGANNTAVGSKVLFSNTTGFDNTAIGFQALLSNTTGINNTAMGFQTLFSNRTGMNNIAVGQQALFLNQSFDNTGIGYQSLLNTTTGNRNTALGSNTLALNGIGSDNTAMGINAMINCFGSSSSFNTAIGSSALGNTSNSQFNTCVGAFSGVNFNMGYNNTIIGAQSDITQNDLFNCVALGNGTRCTASSQVRFGNSFTTSIGGFVGYSNLSDVRYKKNIQEDVKGIDFIMKLRPVTYQLDIEGLNQKLNPLSGRKMDAQSVTGIALAEKTVYTGFVAQEVEQAAKAVGYDFSGVDKPKNENDMYGLRYGEFVVPLVKAVQEQQKIIAVQQQMIDELKKQSYDLQKRVLDLEKK